MITIYYNKTSGVRNKFVLWLLGFGTFIHTKLYYKRTSWDINPESLLACPKNSLGYHLSEFYRIQKFAPIPKAEHHDVFHVLFGYNTDVRDEVCMQFVLAGNGKRSPFTLSTCFISLLLFPEHFNYFKKAWLRGKNSLPFTHLHFKQFLNKDLIQLRHQFKLI
jgi:ubiquinone biosynthesis protein Coq4